ncbi:MAG: hypothetical protein NTU57_00785 [Candidatus Aenigmarchaeota archaeon]|nr:hypothetical protein [Candidatus Aenigmarchaeota archaeon]
MLKCCNYIFRGNYTEGSDFDGLTLTLSPKLQYLLQNHGIKELYLQLVRRGWDKKHVQANPERLSESNRSVEICDGSIKIPVDMIEEAELKPHDVCVLGVYRNINIWDAQRFNAILEREFTRQQKDKISLLTGRYQD